MVTEYIWFTAKVETKWIRYTGTQGNYENKLHCTWKMGLIRNENETTIWELICDAKPKNEHLASQFRVGVLAVLLNDGSNQIAFIFIDA